MPGLAAPRYHKNNVRQMSVRIPDLKSASLPGPKSKGLDSNIVDRGSDVLESEFSRSVCVDGGESSLNGTLQAKPDPGAREGSSGLIHHQATNRRSPNRTRQDQHQPEVRDPNLPKHLLHCQQ
jgi:hypothetical protein